MILLTRADLLGPVAAPFIPGLVIFDGYACGSRSAVTELIELPRSAPLEVEVAELLGGSHSRERQIADAAYAIDIALQLGMTPILYTELPTVGPNPGNGDDASTVASAFAEIMRGIDRRPGFMVVAGTLSGLTIARAIGFAGESPMGEIRTGVPVLRLSGKGRFPGMTFTHLTDGNPNTESIVSIVLELREPS